MRVMKRNPWLTGLGTVLSLVGLWWGSAQGGVASTDQTASLIVFPEVIADGTRDTLIQLVNTSQFNDYLVHCAYSNSSGRCGSLSGTQICTSDEDCPITETCFKINQGCDELDWTLQLTHQQPTIWRVSTGRNPNIGQTTVPGQCTPAQPSPGNHQDCPGAFGASNSLAPNTVAGFRGQLRCWEVMSDGTPVGLNALKGEATIETLGTQQISEYDGIGFRGLNVPLGASVLNLDGHDYDVCPASLQLTHYPVGADDVIARGLGGAACPAASSCPVDTKIAIVPCSIDYTPAAAPTQDTVQFRVQNEFEQSLGGSSAAIDLSCAFQGSLSQINSVFNFTSGFGSLYKTKISPASGGRCTGSGAKCTLGASPNPCGAGSSCLPSSGLLAVAEEFHTSASSTVQGTAAINLHEVGNRGTCTISGAPCTGVNTGCAGGAADLCQNDAVTVVP